MARCSDCGLQIIEKKNLFEDERRPCPQCESLGQALVMIQSETLEVDDRHRMKLKGGEKTASGKLGKELVQGHDFYRKSSVWNYLYRLIDRINDWYHEKITDPKTGKIVYECQEPLSKHQGHGSAKRQGKRKRDHYP